MLQAHCDESHGAHIWSISGFLADDSAWKTIFMPAWQKALDDTRLTEFRAAHCDTGQKAFKGLARLDRAAIQERFIASIGSIRPQGFVTGINLRHHDALRERFDKGRSKSRFNDPYYLAFQHQVEMIVRAANDRLADGERVSFVFDDQKEFKGLAKRLYQELLDDAKWPWRHRLGDLDFEQSHRVLPLQAADLIAHEGFRLLRDEAFPTRGEPKKRWQWRKLQRNCDGPIHVRLFARAQLLQLANALELQSKQ